MASSSGTFSDYFSVDTGHKKTDLTFQYNQNHFSFVPSKIASRTWTKKEYDNLVAEVISQRASGVVDWEKVSRSCGKKNTPMECFIQFRNVVDPSINKNDWSTEEDERLLSLVIKYNEHDWCAIAMELNTNRTPFQCLKRYQQELNPTLKNTTEWTEEEDQQLKDLVTEYGVGNWLQISSNIPGRTAASCLNRYRKSPICNENRVNGQWMDLEEKLLFLAATAYNVPLASSFKKSAEELQALLNGETMINASTVATETAAESVLMNDNTENGEQITAAEEEAEVEHQNNVQPPSSSSLSSSSSSSSAHPPDEIPNTNNTSNSSNSGNTTTSGSSSNGVKVSSTGKRNVYAFKYWAEIADLVPGKTEVQCREKWYNNLDPSIKNDKYTTVEDALLLKVIEKCGVGNWTKIASYIPGRTDASVRTRYRGILKEMVKTEAKSSGSRGGRKRKMT